jgi:hypothetical protein
MRTPNEIEERIKEIEKLIPTSKAVKYWQDVARLEGQRDILQWVLATNHVNKYWMRR